MDGRTGIERDNLEQQKREIVESHDCQDPERTWHKKRKVW